MHDLGFMVLGAGCRVGGGHKWGLLVLVELRLRLSVADVPVSVFAFERCKIHRRGTNGEGMRTLLASTRDYFDSTCTGQRALGFSLEISDVWFQVSGFGFGISDFGHRVPGFKFRFSGSRFRVSDCGFRV